MQCRNKPVRGRVSPLNTFVLLLRKKELHGYQGGKSVAVCCYIRYILKYSRCNNLEKKSIIVRISVNERTLPRLHSKKPLECTQRIDFLILDIKPECSQGTLLMQENPLETVVFCENKLLRKTI